MLLMTVFPAKAFQSLLLELPLSQALLSDDDEGVSLGVQDACAEDGVSLALLVEGHDQVGESEWLSVPPLVAPAGRGLAVAAFTSRMIIAAASSMAVAARAKVQVMTP